VFENGSRDDAESKSSLLFMRVSDYLWVEQAICDKTRHLDAGQFEIFKPSGLLTSSHFLLPPTWSINNRNQMNTTSVSVKRSFGAQFTARSIDLPLLDGDWKIINLLEPQIIIGCLKMWNLSFSMPHYPESLLLAAGISFVPRNNRIAIKKSHKIAKQLIIIEWRVSYTFTFL
jgi:hypothetical protein